MIVGNRATSYHTNGYRGCVARHSDMCKRSCNAVEKVYKTRIRREGKKAAKETQS